MALSPEVDLQKPARFAARQPILSAREQVIAYKLLFRTDFRNYFSSADPDIATRGVIDMSSLVGLNTLCNGRLAFIVTTREILMGEYLALLPPNKTVAEIENTVAPDSAIVQACERLKRDGYKIALGSFTVDDPREPIIGIADFVKVDIKRTPLEAVSRLMSRLGATHCHLLAEKVETREDFEFAKAVGFDHFEGYFFRKPEMMRARGVQTNRTVFLRLLASVSKPDLDWKEVEEIIKADPMLYLRLLRYLNSAVFGLHDEVRSVRQALTFLGENEMRRWCRLTGMLELSQSRPSDLALAALVRARFGELIGRKARHGDTDLFQLGLLSVMDAILEIPMREVLEGLALDSETKTLLLENEGPLLPLYNLILTVEAGVWPAIVSLCKLIGLQEDFIAQCHWSAMEWAQETVTLV